MSATGTTLFVANGTGGNRAFDANIQASWRQLATKAPGKRTVSFPFKSIPGYAAGRTPFWRNPIYGVAGSASGRVEVSSPEDSGSCKFAMSKLPRAFFSGSGVNDTFLDSGKAGNDLVAFVNGQDAGGAYVDAPECDSLLFGVRTGVDTRRERIKRISLSFVKSQKPVKKATLVILRTTPVVATAMKVVGQVTEKAKITLTPNTYGS